MLPSDRIVCRDATDLTDPLVRAAEGLYNSTQHPDERIPWGWIARSLKGRSTARPGGTGRHLLLATPEEYADDPTHLAGFTYGSHIPGYGGYVSYLGVADTYRRRGVGVALFDAMFHALSADADAAGEPLPFVVWESKQPAADAPPADHALWAARLKLFGRAGGYVVDGIDLYTPNYDRPDAPPVMLRLFVKPAECSVKSMTPTRLHDIAAGLLDRVYRLPLADPFVQATLATATTPHLRSLADEPPAPVRRATAGVA